MEGKKTTQLFDLRSDPLETNNLAHKLKYKEKIDEMNGLLQEWINISGDKVDFGKEDWEFQPVNLGKLKEENKD